MNTSPFFITGLPRSRTAWLATYLHDSRAPTYDAVICHHELASVRSPEDYHKQLVDEIDGGVTTVGNSDSGLFVTDSLTRWPESKVVIIVRPMRDVAQALNRLGWWSEPVAQMMDINARWLVRKAQPHPGGSLVVPYADLDNELPEICRFIGVEYSEPRHRYMYDLQVERMYREPQDPAIMETWRAHVNAAVEPEVRH